MTLTEYVEKQIVKLFDGMAEQVGSGELTLDGLSDDEWAGIPMAIFEAQEHMLLCWREFVTPGKPLPKMNL